MRVFKAVLLLLAAGVLLIFLLQNKAVVRVAFLGFASDMPAAFLILLSAAAGFLAGIAALMLFSYYGKKHAVNAGKAGNDAQKS